MHELLITVLFYVFTAIALLSALMVVTQNNPVRCVLFLVLTFFACAVLWLLLSAEFLALILVLVYVGAVMTLFLFVVMMLNIDTESIKTHLLRHLPVGLILVALLTGLLMVAVPDNWYLDALAPQKADAVAQVAQTATAVKQSNTVAIGMALFTDYVYAFELAAVLLLTAIVAAITLTHRVIIGEKSKHQSVLRQLMVRKRDRVRLVKMKTEK